MYEIGLPDVVNNCSVIHRQISDIFTVEILADLKETNISMFAEYKFFLKVTAKL